MPAPVITIRARRRVEKTLSIRFVVSDPAAIVTVELLAAEIPNGAVGAVGDLRYAERRGGVCRRIPVSYGGRLSLHHQGHKHQR